MASSKEPDPFGCREIATPLLVLGIAEVPPPEESLVWILCDHVGAALSDRVDRGASGIVVPDLIKLRGLTPRVPALLRASRRAVVVTGSREAGVEEGLIRRRHRLADRIMTAERPREGRHIITRPDSLLRSGPGPERELEACLLTAAPLGGLDHLIVPLPVRASVAWMIPHLGTWLAGMSRALVDAVWEIMQDEGRAGRRDCAA